MVDGADERRDSQRPSVVIGVIIAVFQAPSFADAPVILFIVGFVGALFATWPIAPAQTLKATADVAECLKPRQARRCAHLAASLFLM